MSTKAVSMNRVYDIFAQETRKQARLYGVELPRKSGLRSDKKRGSELPSGPKRLTKTLKHALKQV